MSTACTCACTSTVLDFKHGLVNTETWRGPCRHNTNTEVPRGLGWCGQDACTSLELKGEKKAEILLM